MEINAYLITGVLGLAADALVVFKEGKKKQLPTNCLVSLFICSVVGMLVGGHLLFFIVSLPEFITNEIPYIHTITQFLDAMFVYASGMVFYGGLLGSLLLMYIYIRISKIPGRPFFNLAALAFPLFHFFGRVGCTLSGCCYGCEYHGPLAIHYTEAFVTPGVNDTIVDVPRFPIQPLEALCELAIFFLLFYLYKKKGDFLPLMKIYLLIYPTVRFLDEFLRGDEIRGFLGPLSTSQWISLFILIGVIISIILEKRKNKEAYPA